MAHSVFTNWQVFDETGRRKYLSDAERTRFLLLAGKLPLRYAALCKTLAFTGCRISEALALARHQLDPERCTLVSVRRRHLDGVGAHHQDARPRGMRPPMATESC